MGLFREQRFFLTFFKWCGILPYIPPAPSSLALLKYAYRTHCLRVGTILTLLVTTTYVRLRVIVGIGSEFYLTNVSYVIWLMAVLVDTLLIVLVLLASVLNFNHFGALGDLLGRLEQAIEDWKPEGRVQAAYGSITALLVLLCVAFHSAVIYKNYESGVPFALQLRVEVQLADFYTIQLAVLLFAVGRSAQQLRRMLHDAIASNNVNEVCAVLRLRDDLVHSVALINRIYGIFFLGTSASMVVAITGILYFDFVLNGAFVLDACSLVQHGVMFLWKCMLTGGLLMLAGCVTDRVKEVTQATNWCVTHPSINRSVAKMVDKVLIKCQFQEINFTVYGLFTIDNSLSYTVICSIVTYVVILVQFQQVEEKIESIRQGQ